MKNMVLISIVESWYTSDDQLTWSILGREAYDPKEGHALFEKATKFLNMKKSIWTDTRAYKQVRLPNGKSHDIEVMLEEVSCF